MPGLLQTEDYAHAVIRATMLTASDEEIERHVAVRMVRQERLTGAGAPEIWAVVGEAVIRRVVGGGRVIAQSSAASPRRASSRTSRLGTAVQRGCPAGMDGAFMILGFPAPTDPDVTYVHYYTGTLYLEKPEDLARYTLMFDHLRAAALPVGQSRDLIARVRDELA